MLCYLCIALVGLAGCNQHPASPNSAHGLQSRRAKSVRACQISSLKDLQGNEVSSADLRGKVVLIDIWATWCQPCKKEMPGYQKLLDRYGSRGFAVVGLKSDIMMDTEDPIQVCEARSGCIIRWRLHQPIVVQKFGGIEGLPTTMIYDRHGILRKKVIGFEYTENFESALKLLL